MGPSCGMCLDEYDHNCYSFCKSLRTLFVFTQTEDYSPLTVTIALFIFVRGVHAFQDDEAAQPEETYIQSVWANSAGYP